MAAKRPIVGSLKNAPKLTQATEPSPDQAEEVPVDELPATGHTRPVGIGLKESEYEALGLIADATVHRKEQPGQIRAIRRFIIACAQG